MLHQANRMAESYVFSGIKMPESEICQKILASNDSTVAVEAFQTGLMSKRKVILFFENFSGELFHSPESAENLRLELKVDATSVACHERSLSAGRQREVVKYARDVALAASQYPEVLFRSTQVSAKALRGFVMHGDLTIRGITRSARANLGLSPLKNYRLQIDADANICLKDFGIEPPSWFFGLRRVKDEAMVHLLLWATIPR